MVKISVCMIVRNEQAVLARCLDCVKHFADELIIVDTGSSDKTKEIAGQYTDYVYDFLWVDDFAAARNYSYSFATGDYIMWVDADDVIDKNNADKINRLKTSLTTDIVMVYMLYDIPENGGCSMRQRLVSRSCNPVWVGALHEVIPLQGNYLDTDIVFHHQKIEDKNAEQKLKILTSLVSNLDAMDFRLKSHCWLDLHRRHKTQEAELVYRHCLREIKASPSVDIASCLLIGSVLQNAQEYQNAINWYEMATEMLHSTQQDRVSKELFQVFQQLVKCYCAIGNKDGARHYNELAGQLSPNSQSVKVNAILLK
ncbi:MAG: glycosyltransferase family 2 protein [Oscillospiraceae bacterium]